MAMIAALLAAGPAEAQCLGFQCPPGVLGAGASGIAPPLDAFATPSAAYSFRKLRSAYAGPAVKLRRTTGGVLDVGFTAAGDFDSAAAATFCAATTCFFDTWYDQSGNNRHVVQATAALQPAYVADCGNGKPCARTSAAGQKLETASGITTVTGKGTMNAVAMRASGGTNYCLLISLAAGLGNQIFINNTTQEWALTDKTTYIVPAAPDGAWHTAIGVLNGASSVVRLDGAEVTGNIAGKVTTGLLAVASQPDVGSTCSYAEAVYWDNYMMTADERVALAENQRDYWTPWVLGTASNPTAAYSFRKVKSTYTGPAVELRRASDNAQIDINFLGFVPGSGAPWDVATATSFCASTTCYVAELYDQSGNNRHLAQATPANQPQLIFNCRGSLPCLELTSSSIALQSGSITPATGIVSINAVANRTVGTTGVCALFRQNAAAGNRLGTNAATRWAITGGTSGALATTTAATDNVWHSGTGVINAAASGVYIDGAAVGTGTVTGSTTAGASAIVGAAATTCRVSEVVEWDGAVLTAAEVTAITANQRSYGLIP